VVEIFAAEHPELTETDRQMLLGWREVVEGSSRSASGWETRSSPSTSLTS
jgi:hypothetical protein